MRKLIPLIIALLLGGKAVASTNDSLGSEMSHLAGGMLMGGVATTVADYYAPEHRTFFGFAAGAAIGVIGEVIDSTDPDNRFSVLDALANGVGAALGAVATDRWILVPVVSRSEGTAYTGVSVYYRF
jgi:VanZ family protein